MRVRLTPAAEEKLLMDDVSSASHGVAGRRK